MHIEVVTCTMSRMGRPPAELARASHPHAHAHKIVGMSVDGSRTNLLRCNTRNDRLFLKISLMSFGPTDK